MAVAMLPCLCNFTTGAYSLKSAGGIKLCRINPTTRRLFRESDLSVVPAISGEKRGVSSRPQALLQKTEQSSIASSTTYMLNKELSYSFSTQLEERVKVSVRGKQDKYIVFIEVSTHDFSKEDSLVLTWSIFRSDASSPGSNTTETPLKKGNSGIQSAELQFKSTEFPFYLSFHLSLMTKTDSKPSLIKTNMLRNFCVPIGFGSGQPAPLGLSFWNDGSINFSLVSRDSSSVILCLYDDNSVDKPALELDLDPIVNKTCDVWHVSFENSWGFSAYGYRFRSENEPKAKEEIFLDPYAKSVQNLTSLGYLGIEDSFNWTGDARPNHPLENLIVYRLNVSKFTEDKSSQLPRHHAGTFKGVADKVIHFKKLGVNAILLEPVFWFDDEKGPYFPTNFFTPSKIHGLSDDPFSSINAMKEMVKTLHGNGIEVLLEVVFTENGFNCNFHVLQRMILDCLHYWVTEFHIDGFCFMNASYLMRDDEAEYLPRSPLVEAIAFDPLLSASKIIADFWDPHCMKQRKVNFTHWKRWAEFNSPFCYDIRSFLRGEGGKSNLATRLCGSGDMFFEGRGPAFSFNYFSSNFGLPLVDLVSFSDEKLESEMSWNCGEEGATKNAAVLEKRLKQIRNYFFILFVSLGVPVVTMGDECGQSSGGSVLYSDRTSLDWNLVSTGFGTQTVKFISFLCDLRARRSDFFQRNSFLDEKNIHWYDPDLNSPNWDDPDSKFLSVLLKAESKGDIFMAFNVSNETQKVTLPLRKSGFSWHRLIDTCLPFPGFFSNGEALPDSLPYEVKSSSFILLESFCNLPK